jgi:undecaprenyl pyrophosphate phosphatase UppP
MHGEDFIPLIAIPTMFITIAFIVYQTLQHRLRMKMVEKGVTNLDLTRMKLPTDNSLKYGLVCVGLGIAIFMGLAFERYVPDLGGEFMLAFAPIFIGVALLISAFIERSREKQKNQ